MKDIRINLKFHFLYIFILSVYIYTIKNLNLIYFKIKYNKINFI